MSKVLEDLKDVKKLASAYAGDKYSQILTENIEKELKLLEMLKKKMTIETDYYDSDFGCEKYEYIAYNGSTLNIDTQEEFNKIKEWLENDK